MNLLWTKGTFRGHPSDESLTEKLSPISRMFINWHVKNCHRCRSRQQALRYVEVYLSAHRQQDLSQTGLIFNSRRDEFITRLDSLLDTLPQGSSYGSFGSWFANRFTNYIPILASASFALIVALAILAIWHSNLPTVSASEFLRRAVEADAVMPRKTTTGISCRRFRVKTKSKTYEHVVYRDANGVRQPKNSKGEIYDPSLLELLNQAGVDSNDPLSPVAFKDWHDQQPHREDEVLSPGNGLLMIRTHIESGEILEESFTVQEQDFKAIERSIEWKKSGTVSISELDTRTLTAAEARVFEAPVVASRTVVKAASQPGLPARSQIDESELIARLILNRQHADMGEQIEIRRDAGGLRVEGLVESATRKLELSTALREIPFLSFNVRCFEDLKPAVKPSASSDSAPIQSVVAEVSPLEQYLVQSGHERSDITRISSQLFESALVINRKTRSITQVLARFSEGAELTARALQSRDELLSNDINILLDQLSQQKQAVAGLDIEFSSQFSPSGIAEAGSSDLVKLAERNSVIVRELISGTGSPSRSTEQMCADLLESNSALRTAALTVSQQIQHR